MSNTSMVQTCDSSIYYNGYRPLTPLCTEGYLPASVLCIDGNHLSLFYVQMRSTCINIWLFYVLMGNHLSLFYVLICTTLWLFYVMIICTNLWLFYVLM